MAFVKAEAVAKRQERVQITKNGRDHVVLIAAEDWNDPGDHGTAQRP
jgi:prevent-host-death family protein